MYTDPHELEKATNKAIWKRKGVDPEEEAYRVAIMDARHRMRHRFHFLKFVLRRLRAFPYVRSLLNYWGTYEECYVWTAECEARRCYLETPEMPDNVIPFPTR